jgi:hypothetical protein
MKIARIFLVCVLVLLFGSLAHADPVGTAFSFQGSLSQTGQPDDVVRDPPDSGLEGLR